MKTRSQLFEGYAMEKTLVDSVVHSALTYPLDRNLSIGYGYPPIITGP